jgi:hypothetical protein
MPTNILILASRICDAAESGFFNSTITHSRPPNRLDDAECMQDLGGFADIHIHSRRGKFEQFK